MKARTHALIGGGTSTPIGHWPSFKTGTPTISFGVSVYESKNTSSCHNMQILRLKTEGLALKWCLRWLFWLQNEPKTVFGQDALPDTTMMHIGESETGLLGKCPTP